MKTFLLSVVLLAFTETLLKPVVVNLTKLSIKKYLVPAYNKLDELLIVPENWQKFIDNAEEFLYNSVLPEDLEPDLSEQVIAYMIKHFDLQTFLRKTEQEPAPVQLTE